MYNLTFANALTCKRCLLIERLLRVKLLNHNRLLSF